MRNQVMISSFSKSYERLAIETVVNMAEARGRYELSMALRMFAAEMGLFEPGYDKETEEDAAYDG